MTEPRSPRVPESTPQLVLREIQEEDAPFILKLYSDPSFIKNIGDRGVHDLPSAREFIHSGPRASYRTHGFGLFLALTRDGAEPVGVAGLVRRDGLDHADLGFAFLPPFWGRGYATESAAAVLEFADALEVSPVLAIVAPSNVGSVRVVEKIGMRRDGNVQLPGGSTELLLFTTVEIP